MSCLAVAAWLPHIEGAGRWVWLGVFVGSLIVWLRDLA